MFRHCTGSGLLLSLMFTASGLAGQPLSITHGPMLGHVQVHAPNCAQLDQDIERAIDRRQSQIATFTPGALVHVGRAHSRA